MRNLLIVLLVVVLVIAGAFLPQLLLERDTPQELELYYPQVTITSDNGSSYAWRMREIGKHYYDTTDLVNVYINVTSEQERLDTLEQFRTQLEQLGQHNVLSQELLEELYPAMDNGGASVSYYYLFDNETVNSFRMAIISVSVKKWEFSAAMDLESGKLGMMTVMGPTEYPKPAIRSESASSWYDVLRGYGDYLGMAGRGFTPPEQQLEDPTLQEYYDRITVDKLAAYMTATPEFWLETRVLQDPSGYNTSICVYRGGN